MLARVIAAGLGGGRRRASDTLAVLAACVREMPLMCVQMASRSAAAGSQLMYVGHFDLARRRWPG